MLDELFKFVNETIKDSFDRSLFCWTDLKQDSKGLTAWYLGVEDYDEVLEPYIESLSAKALAQNDAVESPPSE